MAELRYSYDAAVVGAVMGGLTCGALLAKQGKNVLICEMCFVLITSVVKQRFLGYTGDVLVIEKMQSNKFAKAKNKIVILASVTNHEGISS